MSNRNFSKAIQNLTREVTRLCRSMTKSTIDWLLRFAFVVSRRASPDSGIILPTTIMLILVVSLSVGALTYRAYTRNVQVIAQNQQRVIQNAGSPAIDRARSKLEFLFDSGQDFRYPSGGVPLEKFLVGMMLNDGKAVGVPKAGELPFIVPKLPGEDPYTMPGETRLNLTDATPDLDNAWSFRTDTDGDGKNDSTVIYSILFQTPLTGDAADSQRLLVSQSDKEKASKGVVRHGPLTTETGSACKLPAAAASADTSVGWFNDPTNTSVVRKNFQVDVLVVPDTPKSVATTLEFHQDREINRGNKWAAWWRNDIEVSPGSEFRFNGAIHTEGNLIVGYNDSNFQSYLISSKNSCLYPPIDNSEISITTGTEKDKFKGVIAAGTVGKSDDGGGFEVHYQAAGNYAKLRINKGNDTNKAANPTFVYSDPVAILTEDKRQTAQDATGPAGLFSKNNQNNNATITYDANLQKRILFKNEPSPYIDDLSRADKRWGPKPTYRLEATSGSSATADVPLRDDSAKTGYGYAIPSDKVSLIRTNSGTPPQGKDRTDASVGDDGYWETRARNEGLRVMVGERLELGNPFGWVTPRYDNSDDYITPDPTGASEREGDPLYPPEVKPYPVPKGKTISHLQQQHRTWRDNLAAVQSTALYHSDFISSITADYPFACLASTNHPGTPSTLRQAINFVPTRFKRGQTTQDVDLLTDFFSGRGTNGWEFQPPEGNPGDFKIAIGPTQPLGIALRNLAHFAGDPDGAFPPKQEVGIMHPYPALTMWGNFSNLRRALDLLDAGSYDALSIADKTYIQTAACTVGMLAYEIDTVQQFDPTNPENNAPDGLGLGFDGNLMLQLGRDLYSLMNEGARPENRVLPKALTKKFKYDSSTTVAGDSNPNDYYNVPPEAYIEALRQNYANESGPGFGAESVNNAKIRMAELIMLNFQIRRDRTFGFRPSPSFGHYAIQMPSRGVGEPPAVAVYPSACDPDLFALQDSTLGSEITGLSVDSGVPKKLLTPVVGSSVTPTVNFSEVTKARLGLSRLCGALNIPETGYDLRGGAYNVKVTSPSAPAAQAQARPVVMPKFPALYYLFPEQSHGLAGAAKVDVGDNPVIPDKDGEYDTRQPGTYVASAGAEERFLGLTRNDRESYVIDEYVNQTSVAGSYQFQPVQNTPRNSATPNFSSAADTLNPSPFLKSFPEVNTGLNPSLVLARFPDENRSVFPVPDLSVSAVAGKPRNLPGFRIEGGSGENWKLPSSTDVIGTSNNANVPTNIIEAPALGTSGLANTPVAVPFLDKAFLDPRQLMVARVLDLDVGMMRSAKAKLQDGGLKEPLLPMSGIVYAFREDAVREDGIARPPGTRMNARKPEAPTDPDTKLYKGVSIKSVDYVADPERRIHGFRLRNGRQVKRDTVYETGTFSDADNYRGLSLFTDQPLYIQGDLNRHQTGKDDENGDPLEEFTGGADALIRGKSFDDPKFYNRGGGGSTGVRDDRFASLKGDRWRPTELLADSISIISENFCDGSISDMFVNYNDADIEKGFQRLSTNTNGAVDEFQRSVYHDRASGFKKTGLYGGLGCISDATGQTSFRNSDLPNKQLPSIGGKRVDWVRENPNITSYGAALGPGPSGPRTYSTDSIPAGDYTTPIKISRSGLPVLRQAIGLPTASYNPALIGQKRLAEGSTYLYSDQNSTEPSIRSVGFGPIGQDGSARKLISGSSLRDNDATNVNSIVVSGIVPSKPGSYGGGLHNFPRFIEDWQGKGQTLDYAGSFLQLSFSNYATAPFQMHSWEYDDSGTLTPPANSDPNKENIGYYKQPIRQWGYDVALQFAPAGPAASRFVIVKTPRNEFYSEPQVNDPYIKNLCKIAKNPSSGSGVPSSARDNLNCTN